MSRMVVYFFHGIAVIAFLAGCLAVMDANSVPGSYRLYSASAPQVTQVYTEATFEMLRAIAYLLVAIFIEIAIFVGYPQNTKEMKVVKDDIAATRNMVSKIGGMVQRALAK